MKQNITLEQLDELSDKGKEKLLIWWIGNQANIRFPNRQFSLDSFLASNPIFKDPLLSIGRMIEFLDEVQIDVDLKKGKQQSLGYIDGNRNEDQFCDALWEAVKKKLEKNG